MKEFVISENMRSKDRKEAEQEDFPVDQRMAAAKKPFAGKLAFAVDALILLVAAAASLGLLLVWPHSLSYLVLPLFFLLAGSLHVSLLRQNLPLVSVAGQWVYTLAMAVVAAGLLRSAQLVGLALPLRLVASGAAAYLLPFALSEIWQVRVQLAWQHARTWYPSGERLVQYPSFYFNSTPIRFRILPGKGAAKESVVFRVSNEMSLGKIFYDLVQHKLRKNGREVALADAGRNPFHWMFFTTDGFLFSRALDPEKTIGENGLNENAVIYAQKVYGEDLALLNAYNSENNRHDSTPFL